MPTLLWFIDLIVAVFTFGGLTVSGHIKTFGSLLGSIIVFFGLAIGYSSFRNQWVSIIQISKVKATTVVEEKPVSKQPTVSAPHFQAAMPAPSENTAGQEIGIEFDTTKPPPVIGGRRVGLNVASISAYKVGPSLHLRAGIRYKIDSPQDYTATLQVDRGSISLFEGQLQTPRMTCDSGAQFRVYWYNNPDSWSVIPQTAYAEIKVVNVTAGGFDEEYQPNCN